jgi:dienelactone hydrolase
MKRARRFLPFWAAALGFSALCALVAWRLPEPPHRIEYVQIHNRLGMPLRVVVLAPEAPRYARAPGVVVCQPINDPPEYGRMLELELVREGFQVLTFDWRGEAPGENRQLLHTRTQEALRSDVAAGVAYLRALPGVDPQRVMIAGHSVGGTLAIEAGLADPTLAGVAAIGMGADVAPDQPHNLLWSVGLYDEFRPLGRIRKTFYASVGHPAPEDTTVGNLSKGLARRLDVSPTADHFTEMQDHNIHRRVVTWFCQIAGLPAPSHPMTMEARGLFMMLAWLAVLAGALAGLRRAVTARQDRVWWLRGAAGLAFLAALALAHLRGPHFVETTDALTVLFVFALLGGFLATLEAADLRRAGRFLARLGWVLWASVFLTLVANNLPYYWQEPRFLEWLPEFAVRHVLDLIDGYVFDYARPLLYARYNPHGVSPHFWFYGVILIETLFPALILGLVARVARWRPARQHAEAVPDAAPERPALRPASLVMLLVLAVFLGFVVWLRIAQGFLTGESAHAALRFLARFAVLPFFLFALLWRATRRWATR